MPIKTSKNKQTLTDNLKIDIDKSYIDELKVYNQIASRKTPDKLKKFILQNPFTRCSIYYFVLQCASNLKINSSIIDVGAGDSPYREIFIKKYKYIATDFAETDCHEYKNIDYICTADNIHVGNKSFDSIICTEVLEHVSNPEEVIKEFSRIIKPGGQLFITTPFIIKLHEIPYDYLRYTPYYLNKILQDNDFEVKKIYYRGGLITSISQILLTSYEDKFIKKILLSCLFPIKLLIILSPRLIFFLDKILDPSHQHPLGFGVHAIKRRGL